MKKLLGYTLVEIMIVISIVGILVGFGLSAYTTARERQAIEGAGELIISALHENQTIANVGNKDCNGKFEGQEVVFAAPNIIESTSICANERGSTKQITIPGITFNSTPVIIFNPLSYGVNLNGPSPLSVEYTNLGTDIYSIKITDSGTIEYLGKQ